MNFNKSGIVMASIGNINKGIYLIIGRIDVVDKNVAPTSFPGYSHQEYPGTGARFLGRILKLF